MKRIAALLLLALAFAVSGCSSLTEEELAQLNFIAEEALAEVSEEAEPEPSQATLAAPKVSAPKANSDIAQIQKAKQGPATGKTRRSVAAAVASKIPISSQQGADTAVWQARALIDSLDLDPQDRNTCFRVLKRSFFNRCAEVVAVDACQAGLCYRYQVPAGGDLTIAHDYDSLTPIFLTDAPTTAVASTQPATQVATKAANQAGSPAVAAAAVPKTSATAKPQAQPRPLSKTGQPQLTKAATTTTAAPQTKTADQQDAAVASKPVIPRGVPQDIEPEPEGTDLTSTEFFSRGGFPLTF